MEGVDLAFVGEHFDDDDGGGESERDADEECGLDVYAKREAEAEADGDGEEHLDGGDEGCGAAELFDEAEIEFEADDEEQDRDAEFGEEVDFIVGCDDCKGAGPGQHAYDDEGDDEGLAEQRADHACDRGENEQGGEFVEAGAVKCL